VDPVRLPGREPDGRPRLKPGITWPRLFGFILAVAAIAVFVEHFAEGTYPRTDCEKQEIDVGAHKEGSCFEGNTRLVVVDRHSVLRMGTLEAKLLGIRDRKTIRGPAGSKTANGRFLTVDLAVTNTTDEPAAVVAGQFVLFADELHGESVKVDEKYEPRSFLSRGQEIPPKGVESGTVTFAISTEEAESVPKSGNFDVAPLGDAAPASNPRALFHGSEYGVIRMYK
jgi:hypothetical protein